MIGLLLTLLANTEPSTAAMTDASRATDASGVTDASRAIEVPERPRRERSSRKQRAKAAFLRAETQLEAYFAIEVAMDERSLGRKVAATEAAADRNRAVIERKDPSYCVASWVRIAEIYLHFAEQIRGARGADRDEREAMALGPEQRARRALERARAQAEKHRVRGIWKQRLDRHLDRLRPR